MKFGHAPERIKSRSEILNELVGKAITTFTATEKNIPIGGLGFIVEAEHSVTAKELTLIQKEIMEDTAIIEMCGGEPRIVIKEDPDTKNQWGLLLIKGIDTHA